MGAGRQREFDKDVALERAMELFWRDGYSGTSLSDLTAEMGINKPSLYAAFGNKEELFISALHRYVQKHGTPHFDELQKPAASLKQRVRFYLHSIVRMLTDPKLPGGCFITTSTSETKSHCLPANALHAITEINAASTKAFVTFFSGEIEQGNVAATRSPEELANYLLMLQYGLAVLARKGVKRKHLDDVVELSLSAF